jgi:hypothetical protein
LAGTSESREGGVGGNRKQKEMKNRKQIQKRKEEIREEMEPDWRGENGRQDRR